MNDVIPNPLAAIVDEGLRPLMERIDRVSPAEIEFDLPPGISGGLDGEFRTSTAVECSQIGFTIRLRMECMATDSIPHQLARWLRLMSVQLRNSQLAIQRIEDNRNRRQLHRMFRLAELEEMQRQRAEQPTTEETVTA
jgi:hypothetical protein